MFRPLATAQFKRDRKLMKKRGKEVAKLNHVMTMLAREDTLPPGQHAHRLAGEYQGHWEVPHRTRLALDLVCHRS